MRSEAFDAYLELFAPGTSDTPIVSDDPWGFESLPTFLGQLIDLNPEKLTFWN